MKFKISEKIAKICIKNDFVLRVLFSTAEDGCNELDEKFESETKEIILSSRKHVERLISFLAMDKLLAYHGDEFELTNLDSLRYKDDVIEFHNDKYFPACSYGQNGCKGTPMSWELEFYDQDGNCHHVEILNPEETYYEQYELEEDEDEV